MISVNNTQFDESAILKEMQYHNAETETESKLKASESLIICELLKQRAKALNLLTETADDESDDNADFLEELVNLEVAMPTAKDDECRAYFDQNPNKFMTSPLVEGRHILLASPPDNVKERSEVIDHAKVLIKKLTGNLDLFSDLATSHSRCPSAKTGGSLGQISKGQTVPEFERQLFNCKPGLVSAPIESRYGVHVVLVDYVVPGKALPYELVKERIADYLNEKVRRKAIAQYLQSLISDADLQGFDMAQSESPLIL